MLYNLINSSITYKSRPAQRRGRKEKNVENKKTDVLAILVVLAFFAVIILLVKDSNSRRLNDFKQYSATLSNIVNRKNDKIRMLYSELMVKQKENEDLKNTLTETRNDLDGLSRKLAQPAPAAAPASAPAAANAAK